MPDLVAVGKVAGVFGNKGSLRISLLTDFPSRISRLQTIYLVGKETTEHRVIAVREHRRGYNLMLSGVDTAEKARALVGCYVSVPEEELEPLPEGTYYAFRLVGLAVHVEGGDKLGKIVDILGLPSSDVLVVHHRGKEVLIPLMSEFVRDIDFEKKRVVVMPIEGLIDR